MIRDSADQPVAGARIELRQSARPLEAVSGATGGFEFRSIPAGRYTLHVEHEGVREHVVEFGGGVPRTDTIRITAAGLALEAPKSTEGSGGEQLSSKQVSGLPLNKRDFSQLLLLAAGTQTDANGAANFTQQITVNGQRGAATMFAMDGIDTTDPEMGGATFSNFNVDAIQEIKSSAGVMPAEIGHGAAGITEVITKSGTNDPHGSLFEFVRNAAFDARNFFDRQSHAQPGRIPPFVRNEFGFTNGGPLVIPRVYDGRGRTFYFGQYQGFRQVLGTTQVLPVPTAAERAGRDTSAYPGDELIIPVDPRIASVLSKYPLPNDPAGPFGARTYAISSKVRTVTDQFSIRIDHKVNANGQLFGRFNLNNVDGPLTNPSQTAIDPSYAVPFFDRQRNAGISYTWTPSPTFVSESSIGFTRSTPNFPTLNRTQPGLTFGDALFEPINTPSGSILAAFGNLFQARQNFTWIRGKHTWKAGGEVRVNRDVTLFGTNPNGTYTFGGGTAYATVAIRSRSGLHDIQPGDPLPDSITGFLTATPFSYAVTAAPALFAQGQRMGNSAVWREAYNFYVQDTWKVSPRLQVSYGLRYEVHSRIKEGKHRSSALMYVDANGNPADPFSAGARTKFVINPQPYYPLDWNGWGPRLAFDWKLNEKTILRAGGAITTILPNLWQDNVVTGGLPFVVAPVMTASPGAPLPFSSTPVALVLPQPYTTGGKLIFATGNSMDVPANTEMDVPRFQREVAALSPDRQTRPLTAQSMSSDFRNGYIGSYTAGIDRDLGDVKLSAAYVATMGVKLVRLDFPNGYSGAAPSVARFTQFNDAGQATGGYGLTMLVTNRSHSTYHSLQVSAGKNSLRLGLGFQASYTFSKSIDDSSAVLGGVFSGVTSTILQTTPQDPFNLRGEKGPSTFDATHTFAVSAIQELPFERLAGRSNRLTSGWQLIGMAAFLTGTPFSVFSGTQQTGRIQRGGPPGPNRQARPLHQSHRSRRLLRPGREQPGAVQRAAGPFRNAGAEHVPRTRIPQLRRVPDQEHADRVGEHTRTRGASGASGVLQRAQHRELRTSGEPRAWAGVRGHQSDSGSVTTNPIIVEDSLLARGRFTVLITGLAVRRRRAGSTHGRPRPTACKLRTV